MSGVIFTHFWWFDDPKVDDAFWTVRTANRQGAGGCSLNIAYHRDGDRDNDSLGCIGVDEMIQSREDLDDRPVEFIEGKLLQYNTACQSLLLL